MWFTIPYIFFLIFCMWSIRCTDKTRRQRSALLNMLGIVARLRIKNGHLDDEPYKPLWDVTFFKHYFYLLTFRDPYKLYDEPPHSLPSKKA